MPRVVFKVALPGYRADTDNNPDHFSVYYDQNDPEENVLIKEFTRGSATIANNASQTITHNLGYVPLVFCFVQLDPNTWALIGGDSGAINAYIEVTKTTLIIHNTSFTTTNKFKYYIFYDQIIAPGLITKSLKYKIVGEPSGKHGIVAIAKAGINVLKSDNPNDFIFHSDYNTLKIIGKGTQDFTVTPGLAAYKIAHNLEQIPFVEGFLKEDAIDQVIFQNNGLITNLSFDSIKVDYQYVYFNINNIDSINHTGHISYFLFEIPL